MIGQLRTVVIDCPDPRTLAGFYSELLGLPLDGNDFRVYADPAGHRIPSVDTSAFRPERKRSPCGAGQEKPIRRQGG
ncbi:VOC family protein [Micromonospora sp. NPDC049051]